MALLEGFTPEVPNAYDENGQPLNSSIDFNTIEDAFRSGKAFFKKGDSVRVLDPAGNPASLPSDQVEQALNQGYRLDLPEDQYKRALIEEYTTGSKKVQAAALGALRGISIGLSDVGLEALGVDMEKVNTIKELNELESIGGEVVGTVLPLAFSGGTSAPASVAGKAIQATSKLSPLGLVAKGSKAIEAATSAAVGAENAMMALKAGEAGVASLSALKVIAPKVASGLVEGAVYSLGNALSENALGNADLNAEYLMSHIGTGAVIGASFGGGVGLLEASTPAISRAITKAKEKVSDLSKKAVSTAFNVDPKLIDAYLEKKGTFAATADDLEKITLEAREKVDDVIERYKSGEVSLKDSVKELNWELRDAKESLKSAKESLVKVTDDKLLSSGEKIAQDLERLHVDVVQKSAQAMDKLQLDNIKINTSEVLNKIDDLSSRYKGLATSESSSIAQKLDDYASKIKEISGESGNISGQKAKQLIKELDSVTKYDRNAANFDKALNSSYKQVRYELDSALKTASPEYKKMMGDVSNDVNLLKSLDRYGTEFESSRALRSIKDPVREKYELNAIRDLEKKYGSQYSKDIQDFISQKDAIASLPELKNVENLSLKKSILEKKLSDKAMLKELEQTPAFSDVINQVMEQKTRELEVAGLGGITGKQIPGIFRDAASTDAVKSAIAKEKIKKLESFLGSPGLSKMVEDAGILAKFEKGAPQGSRNTNLWGAIGGLFGSTFDHVMGGAAVGAVIGSSMDKFGPQVAKVVLDKMSTMAAVEKMVMSSARKAAAGINKVLGTKTLEEATQKYSIPLIEQMRDEEKDKKIKNVTRASSAQIESNLKSIRQIASNQDVFIEKINQETKELSQYMPQLANSIQKKSVAAVSFLNEKMPKKDNVFSLSKKDRVSDYALSKFNRYYQAVDNPGSVFKALSSGIVYPEHVETLKTVYPEIYEDSKRYIIENMTELRGELEYGKRLALSQFFDVPLDPSMSSDFVIEMQNNMTPQARAEFSEQLKKESGEKVNLGKVDLSNKKGSMERLATRS